MRGGHFWHGEHRGVSPEVGNDKAVVLLGGRHSDMLSAPLSSTADVNRLAMIASHVNVLTR